MAENTTQDKTEEATPKRRLDAKKKGQVPRSKELNTVVSLLAAGFGMLIFGSQVVNGLNDTLKQGLDFERSLAFNEVLISSRLEDAALASVAMLIPLLSLLFITTLASPFAMGGWVISAEMLAPKMERISLVKGFGRLFSPRSLMELAKTLAKFVLVSIVTCLVLYALLDEVLTLSRLPLHRALQVAGNLFIWCLLGFSSVLVLIAAADVPFQLWEFRRKIRMTKQEVKEELKQTEGRPEVKMTIKERQQEFARQRMITQVPKADVVITNPTHYAVALRYDPQKRGAPVVIAKGRDLVAARIREVATEHNVALFSAPPLARALYASTDLNQEIPANLFLAVAQVLAYIFQLRKKNSDGVKKPAPPKDLPIPEEYEPAAEREGD